MDLNTQVSYNFRPIFREIEPAFSFGDTMHDTPISYVYKIIQRSTGYFYIGMTTSKIPAEEHLGVVYFTTSCLKDEFSANPEDFDKEIISGFKNRMEAEQIESKLIYDNFDSEKNLNFRYNQKIIDGSIKFKTDEAWSLYWTKMGMEPPKSTKSKTFPEGLKNFKMSTSGPRQTVWDEKLGKYVAVVPHQKKTKKKKSSYRRN